MNTKNLKNMNNTSELRPWFMALVALMPWSLIAQNDPVTPTLNAIVTVRVSDLSEDIWPRLSARIAREDNMNIEYSCLTTGILVLQMKHVQASEKADVMAIVKRILHEAGVKGHIDFLDVQVRHESMMRCGLRERTTRSCSG